MIAVRQLKKSAIVFRGDFHEKNRFITVLLYILIGFEDVNIIFYVFWPEKSNDDILEAWQDVILFLKPIFM